MASWFQSSPADAGFSHRDSAKGFVFGNRLWMSNGYAYGGAARRDLLTSSSGTTWSVINASTPYTPYAPIGVHNGEIFVVGDDKITKTTNGIAFTTVVEPTPFSASMVEVPLIGDFHGYMVLPLGDRLRYSLDGVTWCETPAPWSGMRRSHAAARFGDYLYILGGCVDVANTPPEGGYAGKTSLRDVWRTCDPTNPAAWECVTTKAPWSPRLWPAAIEHDGYLWLIGGYNNVMPGNFNDTWRMSPDGRWERVAIAACYSSRHYTMPFVLNGILWIAGGNRNPDSSGTMNDCWYLLD